MRLQTQPTKDFRINALVPTFFARYLKSTYLHLKNSTSVSTQWVRSGVRNHPRPPYTHSIVDHCACDRR